MNRYVTVSLVLIFSLFAYLPASAQLAPQPVECVSGFGFGSTEYLAIDGVYHVRSAENHEWMVLPLPPDAPDNLTPRRATGNTLVYESRGWSDDDYVVVFYYSMDLGESWGSYERNLNTSTSSFVDARENVLLLNNTFEMGPPVSTTLINMNTGFVAKSVFGWGRSIRKSPEGWHFYLEYASQVILNEEPQSPTFGATYIVELNNNLQETGSFAVVNPDEWVDEPDVDRWEMHTYSILHLENRELATTGVGLFMRDAGEEEWVFSEQEDFSRVGGLVQIDDKIYVSASDVIIDWNEPFMSSLYTSDDYGETWTFVTELGETTTRNPMLTLHDGSIRYRLGNECFVISSGTSEGSEIAEVPSAITLDPAYPNPFNPSTTISFALPEALSVSLEVYNITGQRVAVLAQGLMQEGRHNLRFDATDLSSGIYMIRLQAGGESQLRKVTLIK